LSASSASHRTSPIALTTSWCRRLEPILIQRQGERVIQEDQVPGLTETYTVAFEKGYLPNLKPSDFHRLPGDDHLLSLMYYNVFRALVSNAHILGLDTILMHADDYPSPFITGTIDMSRVPANLRPTPLQSAVPHHPCFDIFPDPVVRDNGIRQTSFLPHGMLCMTLAGRHTWFENDRSRRHGLVIWGSPENAASWEVTQGFVRHWGWLVRGSHMLEASTNRWRWTRGEQPLFFA
jgi:Domain of unknown function (DUF3425)